MLSPWLRFVWPVLVVPATCLAWTPGTSSPSTTRGFEVDTSNRNDVVSFYHAVYAASEGYRDRIGWTGNYTSTAAGAEGITSAEFVADVERRLNYYRAMSGIKADVRVNTGSTVNITPGDAWLPAASTTKAAAAQRSALMIIRTYPGNGGLSHSPATNCTAWTTAAWNGNRNGNLALGFYGPGAIDAYFREDVAGTSSWNVDVGHRRWLLTQWSTDFATGDTPGSFTPGSNSIRPPSNAMYVVPRASEVDFDLEPEFAAYPAAGFVPAELNSPFWSLSYPDADFSAATVTLRDATMMVQPATIVSRHTGYGDNSIVWRVPAAAAVHSVNSDQTWHVTVSNIRGDGVPSQHSYQVTLIDPNRLNEAPLITGAAFPLTSGATYQVADIAGADSMEAGMFLRKAPTWTESAEDSPAAKVVARTSSTYAFRATTAGYVKTGAKAFRLTFPTRYDPQINGVPQQGFELDRELLPGAAAKLNFQFRRGLMTPASKLAVESSADDGVTWTSLVTPYSGIGGAGDAGFQVASLTLPASPSPLRIRFRFYLGDTTSALYSHEDYPAHATGVFIDDITVTGGDWLEPGGTVAAPGLSSFNFNSATAGTPLVAGQEWWLRVRAILGGKAFPYGPAKVVIPAGPLQLSGNLQPPVTGAKYTFIPDPAATSYGFEVAVLGNTSWSEGAEASPSLQVSDDTDAIYDLFSTTTGYRKSGGRAFRLGLATLSEEEEFFTIERQTVPTATSALDFWVRRGTMSTTNRLHAELSTDGGSTWSSIWSLAGIKRADKTVTRQIISLSSWAGTPVKVRFAMRKVAGGKNLKWNAKKSGAWIDDITITSPSNVLSSHESAVNVSSIFAALNATSAGHNLEVGSTLQLRLRSVIGTTPGAWGPALIVTTVEAPESSIGGGFATWATALYPGHNLSFDEDSDGDGLDDGIEYAFFLDPTDGVAVPDALAVGTERMEISRDLPDQRPDVSYAAEWSDTCTTWSEEAIEIRFEPGRIIASAPKGSSGRFMRWKIAEE